MEWAKRQLATADLGDQRLNHRLIKVAQQLVCKPSESISTACGGCADTLGAYTLLSNDRFG